MRSRYVAVAAVVATSVLLAGGFAVSSASESQEPTTTAAVDAAIPMGSPPEGDTASLNLAQIAAGTPATQTLTRLVLFAGLLPTVRDGGPFTVFAPVDDAFAAVDPATLRSLANDPEKLASILTLHVVPGALTTDDLRAANGTSLTTVAGGKLRVEVVGDKITVGGATIAVPDIIASNGVVHAVDTVITAPNG